MRTCYTCRRASIVVGNFSHLYKNIRKSFESLCLTRTNAIIALKKSRLLIFQRFLILFPTFLEPAAKLFDFYRSLLNFCGGFLFHFLEKFFSFFACYISTYLRIDEDFFYYRKFGRNFEPQFSMSECCTYSRIEA